jgi:hypothetical protein
MQKKEVGLTFKINNVEEDTSKKKDWSLEVGGGTRTVDCRV